MMLATWLLEIFLAKINELDDLATAESPSDQAENMRTEKTILEEDMAQFLEMYKDDLDRSVVYDLLQSHSRPKIMLQYAALVGDHERIVTYWVNEENWSKAVDSLNRQVRSPVRNSLTCSRRA